MNSKTCRQSRTSGAVDILSCIKNMLACALMVLTGSVAAGDYYGGGRLDTYDPASGLYFKGIDNSNKDRGLLSKVSLGADVININVFDPVSGTSKQIFREPVVGNILDVLFESSYRDGSIEFAGYSQGRQLQNNRAVPKREPKSKLLILVRRPDKKGVELLVSEKRGGGVSTLAFVPEGSDWHLDVRNSKVRIVRQVGSAIQIESYDW